MESSHPYPASSASELGLEDDWSDVKDPKEKKRIQNRIAQRTYRQRLRARLEKLQETVNYHERAVLQNGENKDYVLNDDCSRQLTDDHSPPPMAGVESLTPKSPGKPTLERSRGLQPNFNEHMMDSGETKLYGQHSQPTDTAATQPPQTHSSLGKRPEHTRNQSENVNFDYTQMSKQAVSNSRDVQVNGQKDNGKSNTQEGAGCISVFTPDSSSIMDFSNMSEVWTSEMLSQVNREPSYLGDLPNSPPQPSVSGSTQLAIVKIDSATDMPDSPVLVASNSSLDERFEFMMECVQTAGFDNFDEMITAYYTEDFGDLSPLANAQRMSRNRRLPKVMAEVFQAANQWTDWERRGFHDEILKMTESMLVLEGNGSRINLKTSINPVIDAQNRANVALSESAFLTAKKMIRNEQPNLWALMMALSTEEEEAWHRNRSNTVLAAILVLRCASRMPTDQLLRLLSSCF